MMKYPSSIEDNQDNDPPSFAETKKHTEFQDNVCRGTASKWSGSTVTKFVQSASKELRDKENLLKILDDGFFLVTKVRPAYCSYR
jgi:hypothetical protein